MKKINKLVTVTASTKIKDKKRITIFNTKNINISWDNIESYEPHPNGTYLVLDRNAKVFVMNKYASKSVFGNALELESVQEIHSKFFGLKTVKQICGVR